VSIRKAMANQTIDNLQVQLRQFFEDPDFQLDGVTKAGIHGSFAWIEKKAQAEFAERERFEKDGLPGLAEMMEALGNERQG
jgi:hypothetical protein